MGFGRYAASCYVNTIQALAARRNESADCHFIFTPINLDFVLFQVLKIKKNHDGSVCVSSC